MSCLCLERSERNDNIYDEFRGKTNCKGCFIYEQHEVTGECGADGNEDKSTVYQEKHSCGGCSGKCH